MIFVVMHLENKHNYDKIGAQVDFVERLFAKKG